VESSCACNSSRVRRCSLRVQIVTMFTMRRKYFLIWTAVALAAGSCLGADQPDAKVERGRYVAEEIAKCQDCHTQRMMDSNDLIKSQWLKGAPLSFTPVVAPPNWRPKAPDITSTSPLWQRWGEEGMVKFFETGRNPRGNHADPPMPVYTLSHDDAVAVTAYLKSLK
jgi:mono/diheme cytochrome c family protein